MNHGDILWLGSFSLLKARGNPQAANRNDALPLEKALDALTYVQIELLDVLGLRLLGL